MSLRLFTILGLAVALALAMALSPFASSAPDGLERVAEDQGFLDRGGLHSLQEGSPVPDYAFPGIDDPGLATAAAGLIGTLAVFAVGYGLARALPRRDRDGPPDATPSV